MDRGTYINISTDDLDAFSDWAKPIAEAFIEEFGEDTSYWVDW